MRIIFASLVSMALLAQQAQQTTKPSPLVPKPPVKAGAPPPPPKVMPTPAEWLAERAKVREKNDKLIPDFTAFINAPEVTGDRMTPLSANALKAIALAAPYQDDDAEPMAGPGGIIFYTYGKGLPNIPCKPGFLTRIEFEKGEALDSTIPYGVGDDKVWKVDVHHATAPEDVASIVVRPTRLGAETNLVVFGRRTYDLKLISTDKRALTRVAFRYPDAGREQREKDEAAKVLEAARKQAEDAAAADLAAKLKAGDTLLTAPAAGSRRRNYESKAVRGAPEWMLPEAVSDDGEHTTVKLKDAARPYGLPYLIITSRIGKQLPNIHINTEQMTFLVDGLFDKAELQSGIGKKMNVVEIVNRNGHK